MHESPRIATDSALSWCFNYNVNSIIVPFPLQCHQTRSVDTNRKRAREIMRLKLDVVFKGDLSEVVVKKKESELRKKEKRKKANENLERKRLFKEGLAADSKPGEDTV